MHLEASNVIEIHQGYFGDVGRSHSVRAFSSQDSDLKTKIKSNSDRPFTDDLGGNWPPFTWGKRVDSHYLVMRTFSDLKSDRGGMVFTHALAIQIQDMVRITDIRVVFDLLLRDLDQTTETLSPIRLDISSGRGMPSSDFLRPAIVKILEDKTGVYIGQSGFEDLVAAIWWNLPPKFRGDFSFGACMQEDNLTEQGFDLASIPEQAVTRWRKELLLQAPAEFGSPSPTEAMLLGLDDRMGRLLERLEIEAESFSQLREVEKIEELYARLPSLSFDQLHALINRVNKQVPDREKGLQFKTEIGELFAAKIASGSVSDLKKLRNLEIDGFGALQEKIGGAIQALISVSLGVLNQPAVKDLIDLFSFALEKPISWWSKKAWAAFESWISVAQHLEFVWEFTVHAPKNVFEFFQYIPTTKAIEGNLIAKIPGQVLQMSCEPIIKISVQRKWVRLHAKLVASTMPLKAAILAQIKADTDPTNLSGFEIIASQAKPSEFVALAQQISEDRVIGFAGDFCGKDRSLLDSLDFSNKRALRIFHQSISSHPTDSSLVTEARVFAILDQLIQGTTVSSELLQSFTQLGKSNLLDYPNRSRIWGFLPNQVRVSFLAQTAKAWLQAAASNKSQLVAPEPELKLELEKGQEAKAYLSVARSASYVVAIFRALPGLPESVLVNCIQNQQLEGSSFDASMLAQLIMDYKWSNAASAIYKVRNWRQWLLPALPLVHDLLGFWEQIGNTWMPVRSRVNEDEFWEQLFSMAVELYPKGPDKLIDRLGWDESELSNADSRRDQWNNAIKLTRKGKKGYSVIPLIDEMLKDFQHNEKLRLFKSHAIENRL